MSKSKEIIATMLLGTGIALSQTASADAVTLRGNQEVTVARQINDQRLAAQQHITAVSKHRLDQLVLFTEKYGDKFPTDSLRSQYAWTVNKNNGFDYTSLVEVDKDSNAPRSITLNIRRHSTNASGYNINPIVKQIQDGTPSYEPKFLNPVLDGKADSTDGMYPVTNADYSHFSDVYGQYANAGLDNRDLRVHGQHTQSDYNAFVSFFISAASASVATGPNHAL